LAREDIEQQAESRYGVDATPGEDFTVSRQNGQFVADFTDQYRRSVARARRTARSEMQEDIVTPASPRTGQDGQTEVFIDDIPEGELQNTQQQETGIQATQSRASLDRPSLEINEDIAQSLTTGGLLKKEGVGFDPLSGEFNLPTEEQLAETSRGFQTTVDVAAGQAERIANFAATGDREQESVSGQIAEGAIKGAAQPADVAGLVLTGETAAEATSGIVSEGVENPGATASTAAVLGGTVAAQTAGSAAESLQENPISASTFGVTSLASGTAAGTLTSPIRVTRFSAPVRSTRQIEADIETQRAIEGVSESNPRVNVEVTEAEGAKNVIGVRARTPAALEPITGTTRGRTLAGSVGTRPGLGSPSLASEADNLDLARMGATGTATAEPSSAFEADVFRSTADDIDAGEQFRSAEAIQRQAQIQRTQDFTAESAEEAIGEARAVPESATGDVADALRDLDATVFGSAAARAQTSEFRQPRDLDIVVSDKDAAKSRLAESLEGENAEVSEVFDIKEEADVPGRAAGGETIKFGRESQEPRELGGVPFNPVEEELVRKAGASAFLRERGAAGTRDLDIGPEPRSAGRPDVREKDVTDTQLLAEELNIYPSTLRRFEQAYDLEPSATTAARQADTTPTQSIRRLLDDDRAQTTLTRTRRQDTDVDVDTTRRRTDTDTRRTDRDSPDTSPGSTGTPVGIGVGASPTDDSPSDSAGDGESPTSPGAGESPGDGFGSPGDGPSPGDSPPGNIFSPPGGGGPPGGSPGDGSPPSTGSPPGSGGGPGSPGETPTPPPQATRTPSDLNIEIDSDDEEETAALFGAASPSFTDFRNPLTGEVLETDPDVPTGEETQEEAAQVRNEFRVF